MRQESGSEREGEVSRKLKHKLDQNVMTKCHSRWCNDWNTLLIQSELTGCHTRILEQQLGAWQAAGSQHRVSGTSDGGHVRHRDGDESRLELTLWHAERWLPPIILRHEDTEFIGTRNLGFRTQLLVSLWSGTKVDVCWCLKMEKASGKPWIIESQQVEVR